VIKELNIEESNRIKNKLLDTLEQYSMTPNGYWYPLCEITKDIKSISFLREDINNDNWIKIYKILQDLKVKQIYEVQEFVDTIRLCHFDTYFLEKDDISYDMLFMSECYWYDENYKYLIYTSHEGTISFTGDELVKRIRKDKKLQTIIKDIFYQKMS